ncbi:hypothetical protein BDL97_11G067600 [Sphagnum fallax]|nr:hypothetical protein BDL97_11G067600 [Sphagnum fallax]KAH8947892.1 hypothetical protein BDL97_11G067600 [Sphagnum fallax]
MRSEFSGPTNSVALPEDMKLEETVVVSAQEEEEEEEKKKKNVLVASSLQSENGNNVVAVINPKPAAYNLDEIASNLHETATKALEQAETVRNGATAQASIVEDVAHLVLDHNNNDDASSSSRDYLVGVIQKVADYAEQAGQSKAAALNEGFCGLEHLLVSFCCLVYITVHLSCWKQGSPPSNPKACCRGSVCSAPLC